MENRLWYSESFTRILDKDHRPNMFAAGCLPAFSMHFLETNGLYVCWQCSEQLAQCTSHPRWSYKKQKHLTTCASSQTQQGFCSTAKTQLEFKKLNSF